MLNWWIIIASANQSFSCQNCIFGIGCSLSSSSNTYKSFSIFCECNNWRGSSGTFSILDNFSIVAFHNSNTWVGGSQINANNWAFFFGTKACSDRVPKECSHHDEQILLILIIDPDFLAYINLIKNLIMVLVKLTNNHTFPLRCCTSNSYLLIISR